jgi:hypothetical protein
MQLIEPIGASGIDRIHPRLLRFRTTSQGIFVAVHNRSLFLYISITADYPRAVDLLAASFAAHAMELPSATLTYLDTNMQFAVRPHSGMEHIVSLLVKPTRVASGGDAHPDENDRTEKADEEDE